MSDEEVWLDSLDQIRIPPPVATVILPCNSERIAEIEVEFLDVSEDISGRDLLTFVCPRCGETHQSNLYG